MMENNVVDRLLEELRQKASEIQEIYGILQGLRKYGAEFDLPELSALFEGQGKAIITSSSVEIKPGEFYNLSNTDAAERYLRKIGHAMPLEDIYSALIEGGVRFSGDGRKNLNIQLTRATRKFAKIGHGKGVSFGLLEWYPKRKRMIRIDDSGSVTEQASVEIHDDGVEEKKGQEEDNQK